MHDPRLAGLLGRVNVPSLVVWGREDAIVPVRCGEQYHEALPNSTLKVMEGCGHWPHVEKRDEFIQTVMEFLA
jgi:pimeloyl-ACP methyl ester carboxylesterase